MGVLAVCVEKKNVTRQLCTAKDKEWKSESKMGIALKKMERYSGRLGTERG